GHPRRAGGRACERVTPETKERRSRERWSRYLPGLGFEFRERASWAATANPRTPTLNQLHPCRCSAVCLIDGEAMSEQTIRITNIPDLASGPDYNRRLAEWAHACNLDASGM